MALEGSAQDASKEACASLEDGAQTEGPPNADQAVSEAPSIETTVGPSLHARQSSLVILGAHKPTLPDRLMLGSYVKPMEWDHPSRDISTSGLDAARAIIDRLNPFKKRDTIKPGKKLKIFEKRQNSDLSIHTG